MRFCFVKVVLLTALLLCPSGCERQPQTISGPATVAGNSSSWLMQDSGSTASLRGICAVSESVCWASGSEGTVLLTIDGGESWEHVGPRDSVEMDFRDVHAWDGKTAVIMCAGDPDQLLRTVDGGQNWDVVYEHPDATAFFDGIVFDSTGKNGWLMGDPVDGRLFVLQTKDAGETWTELPKEDRPEIPAGIAGFAASGTNLCLAGTNLIIGLGGMAEDKSVSTALVAKRNAEGKWSIINTPVATGEASGIFSIVALDKSGNDLVAVGGDYLNAESTQHNVLIGSNAGDEWRLPEGFPPAGYRSAVAVATIPDVRDTDQDTLLLITVGPSGSDRSDDNGETWDLVSTEGFHTVSFVSGTDFGWAAGSGGRIGRWTRNK
jgi:photosystem II stability/assembly factor-like uncharacterized protein